MQNTPVFLKFSDWSSESQKTTSQYCLITRKIYLLHCLLMKFFFLAILSLFCWSRQYIDRKPGEREREGKDIGQTSHARLEPGLPRFCAFSCALPRGALPLMHL